MNVIAINGSPRKDKNTATLLQHVLNGASSQGASTSLIHLYDLDFQGCCSCFSCKLKSVDNYGKCAMRDELSPILEQIMTADALVIGSPIYFGTVNAATRAFMERLLYPFISYDEGGVTPADRRKIKTAIIYTMGATEQQMLELGYAQHIQFNELFMSLVFGHNESLVVTDTYQFDDYTRYRTGMFDEQEKARVHREQFPKDCARAYEIGTRLAQPDA